MNTLAVILSQLAPWVPEHEARLIWFHLLRRQNPAVKTFADLALLTKDPSPAVRDEALRIAKARAEGTPLQHLLGSQFFLNHDYFVDASTLIPRPETEILATRMIEYAKKRFPRKSFRFAELGLGSGILSIELLVACPGANGVASELNYSAVTLAQKNLDAIIGRSWSSRFQIEVAQDASQGFEALLSRGPYDLVFSNPPYVSMTDEIEAQVLRHEPKAALFPQNRDPNFFYANFLEHAHELLAQNGAAFFEVPHERADDLLQKFKAAGFRSSELIPDLTGRPRVIFSPC